MTPNSFTRSRPEAKDYYHAIRVLFTLRGSSALFTYDSRMDDKVMLHRTRVSKVEQTISGYAEAVAIKKSRISSHEDLGEAERLFVGKKLYVHINERPKTEMDERWSYSLVLNAIQGEYRPTFHWYLDDRSLFTRISMALIQEKKIIFDIRLRDTDFYFRQLRISESKNTSAVLRLLGLRFWIK